MLLGFIIATTFVSIVVSVTVHLFVQEEAAYWRRPKSRDSWDPRLLTDDFSNLTDTDAVWWVTEPSEKFETFLSNGTVTN